MALVIAPAPIEVAFPTLVTGPVRFALVVTVAATSTILFASVSYVAFDISPPAVSVAGTHAEPFHCKT